MTFHTVTYCLPAQWDVTRGIGAKLQMKKNGGQGNKRALKEKEIEVSVEIVLKKIEGYVIKNYLYLKKVKVSRSININFKRQSTDKLPTDYQQSADMLPTVGRQIAKSMEKTVGRQSVEVSCSSQLPYKEFDMLLFHNRITW